MIRHLSSIVRKYLDMITFPDNLNKLLNQPLQLLVVIVMVSTFHVFTTTRFYSSGYSSSVFIHQDLFASEHHASAVLVKGLLGY